MKISSLLEKKGSELFKIDSRQSVFDAIQLLNQKKIGSLLVMNDEKKLEGIITERDILNKCLVVDKNSKETKVFEIMTTKEDLIIGTADDTVSYAMKVMTNRRIRHLPIVDHEKVIGLVSIGDILKKILEESETEVKLLREYITNPYGINL
ncbi:MAG: CBS domain-containing protein [Candidatus Marinimicrobia bacterium]|nr:CBS domain-containing protein [Candidatus Neomarinimicrobiota bacterium]